MEFGYEWLQEIVVHTELKNVLRLHLSKTTSGYRLYGEFFDQKKNRWSLAAFSGRRVGDSSRLLERSLKSFRDAMKKRKDLVVRIENPCNASYVTAAQQQEMVKRLEMPATVSVN